MRRNKFIYLTWIKIILIILILFANLSQFTMAQDGEPTVNVALTEQNNTADVGPGDSGVVTFTGIVSVSLNQATRVIVNLSAVDTWNSAIVTPNSLVFTASAEKPITVSVYAPLETSFNDNGMVTVTGTWTSYPGEFTGSVNPRSGAVARIDINQFHKFSIENQVLSQEVIPGSEVQFELIINNEGNYIDTFTIDLLNSEELTAKGIDVEITQAVVEIPEKGNETIIISIKTNKNVKQGDNLIQLRVITEKGIYEGIPQQNLTYKLKIKKDPKDYADSAIPNLGNMPSEPFEIVLFLLLVSVIGILLIVYWVKKRIKEENS